MRILVANIGSTSFKYRLLSMPEARAEAEGRVERIGTGEYRDHEAAISFCLNELVGDGRPLRTLDELNAVAFKAVHAGPLSGARLVDDEVIRAMEDFAFLAPAHNPPYVAAMRAFGRAAPGVPCVAVFETAFFDGLDEAVTTYAVPYSWREELGVRRYGFHGASHQAANERVAVLLGRTDVRHISCHLGGSSSLAAIRNGRPIDVSFGLSPQSGLPHNNRVGDIDVFAALYVMKKRALGVDQMARILAEESGLAGLSGMSGDVRDLTAAAAQGNRRARLALDVFVHACRHYLGAFLVGLGGLDALTFSGGIGERSAGMRAAICEGLACFGIQLDQARNADACGEACVSQEISPVKILVLPADEERVVARAAAQVVAGAVSKLGA
jgi:acetate kinase